MVLSRGGDITRRTALKTIVAGAVGAVTGGGAYAYMYARHALETTRLAMTIDGLPDQLQGLRIGLMTDVHCSQWVSPEDIRTAVDRLMAERPDLIVLGGDYVTWGDRHYVGLSAEALSTLAAPYGVFGVLGNHDDDHDMPQALAARGIRILKDARTTLTIAHHRVELAGIRFWTKKVGDIANVLRGASGTVILMAHDPRRLVEAAALKVPLVLSGHTHGGQVVLPGVGAVAARKFPVVAGPARRDGTAMFVSRGVGTVYVPIRMNCPPEIAVLTLQPSGHHT
jgi:predicted MPP superfamily phosphohydrolase